MSGNNEMQLCVRHGSKKVGIARNIKFRRGKTVDELKKNVSRLVETYNRILELESKVEHYLTYIGAAVAYDIYVGAAAPDTDVPDPKRWSGLAHYKRKSDTGSFYRYGWKDILTDTIMTKSSGYKFIGIRTNLFDHHSYVYPHVYIMEKGVDETIYLSEPVGDIMLYWDDINVINHVLLDMKIIKTNPLFRGASLEKTSEQLESELKDELKNYKIDMKCNKKNIEIYDITAKANKIKMIEFRTDWGTAPNKNLPKLMICH